MLVAADRLRQDQLAAVLGQAADIEMILAFRQALRCSRSIGRRDPDIAGLGDSGPGPGDPLAVPGDMRRPEDRIARPGAGEIVGDHAKASAKNSARRFSSTLRLAGRPMPWPSSSKTRTS